MAIITEDCKIINSLQEYSQYQYYYNVNFEDNMLMILQHSQGYAISYIGVDFNSKFVYSTNSTIWKHPNQYEASLWFQHDCEVYFRKYKNRIKNYPTKFITLPLGQKALAWIKDIGAENNNDK